MTTKTSVTLLEQIEKDVVEIVQSAYAAKTVAEMNKDIPLAFASKALIEDATAFMNAARRFTKIIGEKL